MTALKKLRLASGILLIVPLLILLINPQGYWPRASTTGEMLFVIIGIPIIVVNYVVWQYLEPS